MEITLIASSGQKIDARVEVEAETVILHSRGGAKGKPNLRNLDYRPALNHIIERLFAEDLYIADVLLDSAPARRWPLAERRLLDRSEIKRPIEQLMTLIGTRGAEKGRDDKSASGGNRTKRLRFVVPGLSSERLMEVLTQEILGPKPRQPAEILRRVTSLMIEEAIQSYMDGAHHHFGESKDYELVLPDGERLSPEAIFGLALSEVLGRTATPSDFSGGRGTVCFETIENAGFAIIEKHEAFPRLPAGTDEERLWAEGSIKRVSHLRRERSPYLARLKKRRFVEDHGHLFCERCKVVPSRVFGLHGDACIEVHHSVVAVAKMDGSRGTRLSDLQCLCANCHRIVHREQLD